MAKSAAAESRKPPRIQKHAELVPGHQRLAVRNAIEQGARRIIAVAQRKGGSGKTTCARTICELASIPEAYGIPTLGIDFDSQCSLSKLYLRMEAADTEDAFTRPPLHPDFDPETDSTDWDGRSSSADLFFGDGGVAPYPVTRIEGVGKLDLLPGNVAKLIEVEEHDRTYLADRVQNRLRDWAQQPDVRDTLPAHRD